MTRLETAVLRNLAADAKAREEADEGNLWRRLRQLGVVARIVSLVTQPLPDDVVPPPPPPSITTTDTGQHGRRDRGKQRPPSRFETEEEQNGGACRYCGRTAGRASA